MDLYDLNTTGAFLFALKKVHIVYSLQAYC